LTTGKGADDVVVNGDVYEGSLQTGPGNNVLEIGGIDFVRGHVDMEDDYDVFVLRDPRSNYTIKCNNDHYIIDDFNQSLCL